MTDRPALQTALEMFLRNYGCAESTLTGLVKEFGLECNCAPRIATAFGGGMGGQGKACGALSGAMMALSLKFGREQAEDNDAKFLTYAKVRELFKRFEKELGTCNCYDLIGIDLTTSEGLEKAKEIGLHANVCSKYVRFAVENAAELLSE